MGRGEAGASSLTTEGSGELGGLQFSVFSVSAKKNLTSSSISGIQSFLLVNYHIRPSSIAQYWHSNCVSQWLSHLLSAMEVAPVRLESQSQVYEASAHAPLISWCCRPLDIYVIGEKWMEIGHGFSHRWSSIVSARCLDKRFFTSYAELDIFALQLERQKIHWTLAKRLLIFDLCPELDVQGW